MSRLAAAVLSLAFAGLAHAAEGDFDPAFGTAGKVTRAFDLPGGSKSDNARSTLIINPTNLQTMRYIVVGSAFDSYSAPAKLALAAYKYDGKPDNTFFNGNSATLVRATALADIRKAILVNDKIVVMGMYQNGADVEFGLQRFNLDGSSDLSYGFWSLAIADFDLGGSNNDYPFDLAADAAGNVYVAGQVQRSLDTDFGVAKFAPNGTLDPWFFGAKPGRVAVKFDVGGNKADGARAIALMGNSLVVGGFAAGTATRTDAAMAMIDKTNGALVTSFCPTISNCSDSYVEGAGKRTLELIGAGLNASISALVPDFTGTGVYVIGTVSEPTAADPAGTQGIVARVFGSGSYDASWGDFNASRRVKLFDRTRLTAGTTFNGKLIVTGASYFPSSGDEYGLVYRFNANGTPDTTFADFFGPTPMQIVDFPQAAGTKVSTDLVAITISNTKVVLTGSRLWSGNDRDFAIARLKGLTP